MKDNIRGELMNEEANLTPQQLKAVNALFTERTKKAAAEKAGISTVTLWRWSKKRAFILAYKAMAEAQWEALLDRARQSLVK